MKALASAVVTAALLLLSAAIGLAQSRSGTIYGQVKDTTGAVIAGAKVNITDQGRGTTRTITTNSEGRYVAPLLSIGTYKVQVESPGFSPAEISDLTLEIQENKEVNFTLRAASVTETVTVPAAPIEVERADATLGQVIHAQQVAQMPLNGRNFVQLGTLAPGAVKGEGTFFNNRGNTEVSIRGSVSLSVQGMRENANDWLLDGIDNNELTAGAISIMPSIDAIQEFKVLTFNYSAEYGSRGSATVLVNTKSGTNVFHGTAFEFLRNDHLDARNFFDGPKKGKYNQNQFGGSFGGPILKNKTFFFGDYQGMRIRQGLTFLSTVPTEKMRRGDFTESFPDSPMRIIYDPATTRTGPGGVLVRDPFPGNIIPANRLDPIGVALVNLFPLPNIPGRVAGNYLSNPVKRFNQDAFNVRVDHNFSAADSLFVRFSFDHATQFFPNGLPGFGSGPSAAFSSTNFRTDARNVAISETHTFSPVSINQFTAGFNRVFNRMRSIGQGTNLARQLGIPGANLGDDITSGVINIGLSGGFNRIGDRLFTPFVGGTNVYQAGDTFGHIRGDHTVKFGFNLRAMQMNTLGATWPHGNFNFDIFFTAGFNPAGALNSATGHSVASLLLGLPASGTRSNQYDGWMIGRRWKEYRWFLQDDWKVSSSLTLNLGLAYDITTPQTEAHNRIANFDPVSRQWLIAGRNTDEAAGVSTDWNNLQPRIGLAWSPGGSTKTVVRAGYGIFFDVSANGGVQGLYQNPPFAADYSFTANNITPVRTLATGFPDVPRPDPSTYTGNVVLFQRDFTQGKIQQWNLNLQHELAAGVVLTLAYAGTRGSQIQGKGYNTNTAPPGPGFNTPARRPFPQYNNFNAILSRGLLRYDSFQVRAEKRLSHGLYVLSSYTWSKAFTNGLSQNVGVNTGVKYFPVAPAILDKGLSDTDVRHSFTVSYLYDLPFGRGRAWASGAEGLLQAIIGNWQLSGITRARSGFALPISVASNQSGTALGNRPDVRCNPNLPKDRQSVTRFFDTSCFVAPAPGVLGNAYRTPLVGPGLLNFDFSILKVFPIREETDIQFRTEIFNLFNSAQFDAPGTTFGAADFGRITSTISPSRQIQFGLKFRF